MRLFRVLFAPWAPPKQRPSRETLTLPSGGCSGAAAEARCAPVIQVDGEMVEPTSHILDSKAADSPPQSDDDSLVGSLAERA